MTVLSMIGQAAKRLGLTAPSAVIGNTNKEVIQLLNLANEEGDDLAQRHRWQRLINESTFTSVATESQGAMTTLAGAAFGWICNDTVWNRSRNRKMFPVDDTQWQAMKSNTITGPDEYFRIRGNNFIVIPTMTAGHTVAFEWVSKNWCQSSGGTGQSAWTADTDTGVLSETLMLQGVIWRFKKYKGLDYAEDFNQYEAMVANAVARDGAKKRLATSGPVTTRFLDRRSVSEGSWS